MAKTKACVDVTDAEIGAAIARGKVFEQYAPRAVKAAYREKDDVIAITLSTGIEIAIPRKPLHEISIGLATAAMLDHIDFEESPAAGSPRR